MDKLIPSYKTTRLIRKAIPYIATYMATLGGRRNQWGRYWHISTSSMYRSFLGRLKTVVSLPDGCRALIRPFSLDDAIIPEIFECRSYELYGGPKPGDIVIDAGAHVGFFTIRASRLVGPNGLVIAIEPHPENYSMLLQNIKLNSLHNVLTMKVAFGDGNGQTKLFLSPNWNTGLHSIVKRRSENFVKVHVVTLDWLVKKLSLTHIDFIKIDVEGAEYLVLKGGRETLRNNNVKLTIETTEVSERIRMNATLFLKELGYKVIDKKLMVYAWRG